MSNAKTVTVAITGASGAVYARHFLQSLLALDCQVKLVISAAGACLIEEELPPGAMADVIAHKNLQQFSPDDIAAPIASGSLVPDAMVVIPASMGTVGRIRAGLSSNLIERAADVIIKERKPLLLVPRETPFNTIHLENMLALAKAGAVIMPAAPAFYHRPESLEDLHRFISGRLLCHLGIDNDIAPKWVPRSQ
ncbi:UbiX family flavin prenyltransferase [Planctomycetota bacterium]